MLFYGFKFPKGNITITKKFPYINLKKKKRNPMNIISVELQGNVYDLETI